eukprot:m.184343 g.184343  ORF g.184343 m.184343 type:complete len:148 (+) comp16118_c0_seq1:95-538(+)
MTTIAVPAQVIFEKEEDLPNGTYCTGGPVGQTVSPMVIHAKHGFTTQQMHDVVRELCLERAAESSTVQSSGPSGSTTRPANMKRTAPDTISMKMMGMNISNRIIIKSIMFRGGAIAINEQTMVKEGDGYDIKVLSIVDQSMACCAIL